MNRYYSEFQSTRARAVDDTRGGNVTHSELHAAMMTFWLVLPTSQDFYLKIVLDDLSQTSVRFRWRIFF